MNEIEYTPDNQMMVDDNTVDAEQSSSDLARKITIETLNHGFIVNVGCHRFAIERVDKLCNLLSLYLQDPQGIEKKWFNKELYINEFC